MPLPPPPITVTKLRISEHSLADGTRTSNTLVEIDAPPVDIPLSEYGDALNGGWEDVEDAGALITLLHDADSGIVVPAFNGGSQIVAIDLNDKSEAWRINGWEDADPYLDRRLWTPILMANSTLLAHFEKFTYELLNGFSYDDPDLEADVRDTRDSLSGDPNADNMAYVGGLFAPVFNEDRSDDMEEYLLTGSRPGYRAISIADGSTIAEATPSDLIAPETLQSVVYGTITVKDESFSWGGGLPADYPTYGELFNMSEESDDTIVGSVVVLWDGRHVPPEFPDYQVSVHDQGSLPTGDDSVHLEESAIDTVRVFGVVVSKHVYTYTAANNLPWDHYDCVSDGTYLYFLPGRSADKYPTKYAVALEIGTFTEVWRYEFTDLAGLDITRSNAVLHGGRLIIWMENAFYVLNAATGALVSRVASEQTIRADAKSEDLMVAGSQLVWADDTNTPSIAIKTLA